MVLCIIVERNTNESTRQRFVSNHDVIYFIKAYSVLQGGAGELEWHVPKQRHHNVHTEKETELRAELVDRRSREGPDRDPQHPVAGNVVIAKIF